MSEQKKYTETTLLLVKPDGIERGLIGDCISRFEKRGFQIVGLKMVQPSETQIRGHYNGGEEWLRSIGQRTTDDLIRYGKDPQAEFGTTDTLEMGKAVVDWLVEFMSPGPIVAIAVQGINAVEMGRKIVGSTLPQKADIGSIRGDYSVDSPIVATLERRPMLNIIHASGSQEEAIAEVAHWFSADELHH